MQIADSASLTNGNSDGFTYCGARTYSFSAIVGPLPPYISVAGDTLTIETSDPLDVGTVNLQVQTTLDGGYPPLIPTSYLFI